MGFDVLARQFGRQPEAMHAEQVDGWPLAVADAIERKRRCS